MIEAKVEFDKRRARLVGGGRRALLALRHQKTF